MDWCSRSPRGARPNWYSLWVRCWPTCRTRDRSASRERPPTPPSTSATDWRSRAMRVRPAFSACFMMPWAPPAWRRPRCGPPCLTTCRARRPRRRRWRWWSGRARCSTRAFRRWISRLPPPNTSVKSTRWSRPTTTCAATSASSNSPTTKAISTTMTIQMTTTRESTSTPGPSRER